MNTTFLFVKKYKFEASFSLFFVILYAPAVHFINFYQNDDWYYYKQVELFLQGNFKLLNDIGMTFYLQGFIGALFSLIFGVKNIPLLTLFFSAASFFIFLIILRVNNTPKILGLLSSIIFISQPVFSYSILGFMGENYQLLFVLLSLLFINLFLLSPTRKVFLMVSLFFVFLSFLVKQNTLVLYLSFGLVLIFIREYKSSLLAFFSFLLNIFFYQYIFPKTQYMMGAANNISLSILVPQNLLFFTYTGLSYLLILVIPLFSYFPTKFNIKKRKIAFTNLGALILLLISLVYMYLQYSQFKIHPYFGNTFGHLGYLYGSIEGIKPTGIGMPRIFTFFTSIAPVILAFYLFFFSKEFIKKINPVILLYLVSFLATFYSGFLLVKYFDRYLLLPSVLILIFTTLLLRSFKINKMLLALFLPFLFLNFYISYLFSWEFVLVNNYVWQESTNLVQNKQASEELIYGNGAWIEKFNTKKQENCSYVFNYDPKFSQKNPDFRLVNVKTFNSLKPFYPNLKIYLYEKTKS